MLMFENPRSEEVKDEEMRKCGQMGKVEVKKVLEWSSGRKDEAILPDKTQPRHGRRCTQASPPSSWVDLRAIRR